MTFPATMVFVDEREQVLDRAPVDIQICAGRILIFDDVPYCVSGVRRSGDEFAVKVEPIDAYDIYDLPRPSQ
jgi:hypothetical protein